MIVQYNTSFMKCVVQSRLKKGPGLWCLDYRRPLELLVPNTEFKQDGACCFALVDSPPRKKEFRGIVNVIIYKPRLIDSRLLLSDPRTYPKVVSTPALERGACYFKDNKRYV
jgi:hypothetical protein